MVKHEANKSHGDGWKLLFGDAVLQCGLDSVPCVAGGCWRVIRVAVECFDEFLGVVTRPSCGLKDEWGQVDARVPNELFLFFAFGQEASKVKHDIHASTFRLSTRLGSSGEVWDGLLNVDISQAIGERGVPLVYTTTTFAHHAM